MKLKIETWPISKVLNYARNARLHSDAQVQAIGASMKEFGFVNPCLVDAKGVLIAGHGRILGAKAIGMATVPVIRLGHLSEDQARALRIADNALPEQATWSRELLVAEIGELRLGGYDLKLLGFSEVQLRNWSADRESAKDDIPKIPKKPVAKMGDVWVMGAHRLICGDSTKLETWKELFGRDRASMVYTDAPYGVSYQGDGFDIIEGDEKRRDDLYKMLIQSLREMMRYADDAAAFYIWHASSTREDFAQAMKAVGLVEKQYLIWVKPTFVFGRADYQWAHEPCFYASKDDHQPKFYGERAESTVWHAQLSAAKDTAVMIGSGVLLLDGNGQTMFIQSRAPKNKKVRQVRVAKDASIYLSGAERQDGTVWEVARDGSYAHPTQKPVELARRAIENSSQPGQIVSDGFLGGGGTLIAAEMTGRRCYACEIDPQYVQVCVERWEKFSGPASNFHG